METVRINGTNKKFQKTSERGKGLCFFTFMLERSCLPRWMRPSLSPNWFAETFLVFLVSALRSIGQFVKRENRATMVKLVTT